MPRHILRILLLVAAAGAAGCRNHPEIQYDASEAGYNPVLQEIEYPDAAVESVVWANADASAPPPSVRRLEEIQYWPMSLEEAIQLTLANSKVVRDLGGRVVANPGGAPTVFDPALVETDPLGGPEAALAAFDAQFETSFRFRRAEGKFNNRFLGLGAFALTENVGDFRSGISKTAATGTQFRVWNGTLYNRNTSPDNAVPSIYDTTFHAEFRHPLLQGGGVEFNRIAGPNASPGMYGGVLIGRIRTDVALADFEGSIGILLQDVVRTYWELYFAYRGLEAKLAGRRRRLETWQLEERRVAAGQHPPDQEAFAREQFYLAQSAVENAFSGTALGDGVYAAELRLRSLLGLPASDGRLIQPSDPPLSADIRFDWGESLGYALTRRVELRRQRLQGQAARIGANRCPELPPARLDLLGEYAQNGFGDDLFGGQSAFEDLLNGGQERAFIGFELTTPVGNRLGHAAVKNAELWLQREAALLEEQERLISQELRLAFTELDRAYAVARSSYNRRVGGA